MIYYFIPYFYEEQQTNITKTIVVFSSMFIFGLSYMGIRFFKTQKLCYYFMIYPKTASIHQILKDIKRKTGWYAWIQDYTIFFSDTNGFLVYISLYSLRKWLFLFDPLLPWRYLTENGALNGIAKGVSGKRMISVMKNSYNSSEIKFSSELMRQKVITAYILYVKKT